MYPQTQTASAGTAGRQLLKTAAILLLWVAILLLALWFIQRDALRYFSMDETIFGRFWAHRLWLVTHIVGGLLALLMGPFQFWSGLRRRALSFHRWTGRLYLAGVVLAAVPTFHLVFYIPPSDGGWVAGSSLVTLALVWLASSAMALRSILNGQVEIHKEWMIRSYVLAFSFVNFRWWMDWPVFANAGTFAERLTAVVWLGWTVPLFLTEVILQWRRTGRMA